MTDYADNFTNRLKLDYTTMGRPHSMVFRASTTPGALLPALIDDVEAFLNSFASFRFTDWTVTGASYAQAGVDFFLPVVPPVINAGLATVGGSGRGVVNINFQGLSTLGNRASIYVYGVNVDPIINAEVDESDYRILRSEDAVMANALDALAAATAITAIDGASIFWHQYANVNVNSYWQRKSRG